MCGGKRHLEEICANVVTIVVVRCDTPGGLRDEAIGSEDRRALA